MGALFQKRIKLVAAALLTLAGISTFPADMSALITDIANEVEDNPVGAILVVLGVALAVYALWDDILGLFDIQSTPRLGNAIKDSLHLKHGWALKESSIRRDGFRIVAEFHGRSVTFLKDSDERTLLIGVGIIPDAEAKQVIDNAPDVARRALVEELTIALSLIANIELSLQQNESGSLERVAMTNRIEVTSGFNDFKLLEGMSAVVRGAAVVEAELGKWARALEATKS
jgi:hypothetical protein